VPLVGRDRTSGPTERDSCVCSTKTVLLKYVKNNNSMLLFT
jgi:hypothetical protein